MGIKNEVCEALYNVDFTNAKGERVQAIRFGKEIGTSGIFLPSYFDHRVVSAVPESAATIIGYMQELVKNSGGNFVLSSADAGIYWGGNVALPLGRGFALVRKDGKLAGAIPDGAKVDIIDDLNTSLKTVVAGIKCIIANGGEVNGAYVDIDRQKYNPELEQVLKQYNTELVSAVTEGDLIAFGLQIGKIKEDDFKLIKLADKDYEAFAVEVIKSDPEWVKNHRHYENVLINNKNRQSQKICNAIEDVLGGKIEPL